jgi:hypothetical protein
LSKAYHWRRKVCYWRCKVQSPLLFHPVS